LIHFYKRVASLVAQPGTADTRVQMMTG